MSSLIGKNALVCGSSQGIGLACAVELARLGANVTLVSRNEPALTDALATLPASDGQTHGYMVADFDEPDALKAKVEARLGEIGVYHILLNNTGGPAAGPAIDATVEQFVSGLSKHLICNHILVQAIVPGMKQAKFGRIVNIISTSVIQPIMGLGVSNTTRGAVANWGRTLAGELASFGITVNNVLPGYTATERLPYLFAKWAKRDNISEKQVEQRVKASIPAARLADPSEIGAVVGFLASPAASYLTGVNLPVDGGRTAVQ